MSDSKEEALFDVEFELSTREGIRNGYTAVAEAMRTRKLSGPEARAFLALLKQASSLLPKEDSGPVSGRKDVEKLSGPGPRKGVTANGPMGVFNGDARPGNPWKKSGD